MSRALTVGDQIVWRLIGVSLGLMWRCRKAVVFVVAVLLVAQALP